MKKDHVLNSGKWIGRMIDSYVAGFSYLGNNLGMTLMRKDPSLSSAVDLQSGGYKREVQQPSS